MLCTLVNAQRLHLSDAVLVWFDHVVSRLGRAVVEILEERILRDVVAVIGRRQEFNYWHQVKALFPTRRHHDALVF